MVHLRGRTKRQDYTGIAHERPWSVLVLVIAFLSLIGIPPLVGFVGKLQLFFFVTIEGGYAWLAVVALANTVASLFYYLRVIGPAYFGKPAGRPAVLGPWSGAVMLATGASVIVFGLGAGGPPHAIWQRDDAPLKGRTSARGDAIRCSGTQKEPAATAGSLHSH
ncbi:proton-conducting transporter membrane subunit [Roseibium salinum]|nr:proton-conducting transporter membrane subunit [Roseibium salinum]